MYGDQSPTDRDHEKAEKMFHRDGKVDVDKLADQVVMNRRYSVKHHYDIDELNRKEQAKGTRDAELHTAIVGNEALGIEGMVTKLEKIDTNQTQVSEALTKSNSKQNYIAGIGACLVVVVPIIIMLIMAVKTGGS
jgi:hypothetical protein